MSEKPSPHKVPPFLTFFSGRELIDQEMYRGTDPLEYCNAVVGTPREWWD